MPSCEKHFHSLDRSAVIGWITADHDLRLGYEPIIASTFSKSLVALQAG